MKDLIVATRNQGKLREIKELLQDHPLTITSLADYPDMPDIVEDGETFTANALKKAAVIAAHTGGLVMGEDSGLEVEALDNRPGIYSARFSGDNATDESNNAKLLEELAGVPTDRRRARYQCHIALVDGDTVVGTVDGQCEGLIIEEERGQNGFGYDPLFLIPAYGKTFGELDPAIKANLSHRARALEKFKILVRDYLRAPQKN